LRIEDEQGDAEAHWDDVLAKNGVRDRIFDNIDSHQSILLERKE